MCLDQEGDEVMKVEVTAIYGKIWKDGKWRSFVIKKGEKLKVRE